MRRKTVIRMTMGMAVALSLAGSVLADEVDDAVKDAMKAYNAKEYGQAVQMLDYAAQLIRQQKGGVLEGLLPQPLEGWEAEKASSQAAGSAMFGGGVTAERRYKSGSKRVTVTLITDSPMVQSMLAMYRNPMFATAGGGKVKRLHGETAVVKYEDERNEGEITLVVNDVLLTVKGKAEEEELMAYAERIDVSKLK